MSTLGEPNVVLPPGTPNFTSLERAVMDFKRSKKLPAMVKDFTASAFLPSTMRKPALSMEKSPVTAFAPACRPFTSVI